MLRMFKKSLVNHIAVAGCFSNDSLCAVFAWVGRRERAIGVVGGKRKRLEKLLVFGCVFVCPTKRGGNVNTLCR